MTKISLTDLFHSSKITITSMILSVSVLLLINIVINDEELKRMGQFDDKVDIYNIEKDLLFYRT